MTCDITKTIRSSLHSLTDMGDNGGVLGSDIRVNETYPGRKVDIRSICNYEINAIPLMTEGGVTSTTSDEVMLIMHQRACHGKNMIIHSSI